MDKKRIDELRIIFEKYLTEFDYNARLKNDPVFFPHGYKDPCDIGAAAIIASSFAYGKVSQFFIALKEIFKRLDALANGSIYHALLKFDPKTMRNKFEGINYRFNKSDDILIFIAAIGDVLKRFGPLHGIIDKNYGGADTNLMRSASILTETILNSAEKISLELNGQPLSKGVSQLLPRPEKNSTCKRLCMFLRWLVRGPDKIDFGLCKNAPASKLIIPLDTHIHRISGMLGLTRRADQSLKTAVEITDALKSLDPRDPVKYDFALCHIGISGFCRRGGEGENCHNCVLHGACDKAVK